MNNRLNEPMVYCLPQLIDLPVECCCRQQTTSTPRLEELEEAACVPVQVSAGTRHTAILTSCGAIYTSGCNNYGQLGLPKTENVYGFQLAKALTSRSDVNRVILMAQCWNTILLRKDGAKLDSKK